MRISIAGVPLNASLDLRRVASDAGRVLTATGFWQRYTGLISGDGNRITGAWEGSADGQEWKRDFGLTYIKIGKS